MKHDLTSHSLEGYAGYMGRIPGITVHIVYLCEFIYKMFLEFSHVRYICIEISVGHLGSQCHSGYSRYILCS